MRLGSACARYGSFTYRQRSGKGNVFSRMCLSVRLFIWVGGPYRALAATDMFKLVQLGPHYTWIPPQTRSNLFKLDLTWTHPSDTFKLVQV